MKTGQHSVVLFLIFLLAFSSFGLIFTEVVVNSAKAQTTTTPVVYNGSVEIRAWIDGNDYLCIQQGGGIIWYHHNQWALPGWYDLANGTRDSELPTTVDNYAWYPDWGNITNKFRPPSGLESSKYISTTPHPNGECSISKLNVISARGGLSVVESPSSNNNYTAKVLLMTTLQMAPIGTSLS
jgi:hypothetical protein